MKKILLILSIFSSFAFAGIEDEYKSEVEAIEAKANVDGNLATMEAAVDEAYESYDKLLNKYYSKLMSVIDEKSKKTLKESQKEWIKFRDKEDNFQNILYKREGKEWSLYSRLKRNRIIKHRVDELVQYLIMEGE